MSKPAKCSRLNRGDFNTSKETASSASTHLKPSPFSGCGRRSETAPMVLRARIDVAPRPTANLRDPAIYRAPRHCLAPTDACVCPMYAFAPRRLKTAARGRSPLCAGFETSARLLTAPDSLRGGLLPAARANADSPPQPDLRHHANSLGSLAGLRPSQRLGRPRLPTIDIFRATGYTKPGSSSPSASA
jgi:hypothetical protein